MSPVPVTDDQGQYPKFIKVNLARGHGSAVGSNGPICFFIETIVEATKKKLPAFIEGIGVGLKLIVQGVDIRWVCVGNKGVVSHYSWSLLVVCWSFRNWQLQRKLMDI